MYGLDVTFPIHLQLPVYQLLQDSGLEQSSEQNRVNQVIELDEVRRKEVEESLKSHSKMKKNFDSTSRPKSFQIGDTVLLWDKRKEKLGKHGKFDSLWMGPYIIQESAGANSFHLSDLDGEKLLLPVKGRHLKTFYSEII